MLKAFFESIRPQFQGTIEFDSPLSKVSYYRIGGSATVLVTPRTMSDLSLISHGIHKTGARFFILGWGSNLLFSDEGFSGVVIRMKHLFTEIEVKSSGVLRLGASVGASLLLRLAQEKGYGGLERLTGIPGSVGGMIAMNAGTHLGEIKDLCTRVEWVRLGEDPLEVHTRTPGVQDFSYRQNHFLSASDLITHVEIRYEQRDPYLVKKEIDELYQRRKQSQPVEYPSCGSVFKNPKGKSGEGAGFNAWQVIDQVGLRGYRIGNAQISEKHPNFIVNLGDATAADVMALIALAKQRARDQMGIELQEEVKLI